MHVQLTAFNDVFVVFTCLPDPATLNMTKFFWPVGCYKLQQLFLCPMSRTIIAILLLISSCAVIMQGVLAYELNMTQSLIAEEETHDDKPADKGSKSDSKEKYHSTASLHAHSVNDKLHNASVLNDLRYFTGFTLKPYMPPDLA